MVEAGWPVDRIDDYDDWRKRVEAAMRALPDDVRQHTMLALMDAFAQPMESTAGSLVPSEKFCAAMRAGQGGDERAVPHLSKTLIKKYLADLVALGILPTPTGGKR